MLTALEVIMMNGDKDFLIKYESIVTFNYQMASKLRQMLTMTYEPAYILTLKLDEATQAFFDELRQRNFPSERNYLSAHLTLFHKLPPQPDTISALVNFRFSAFQLKATSLKNLGKGVAYRMEAESLSQLHGKLKSIFVNQLSAQDNQGFRGHVTVQNKVSSDQSKQLLLHLTTEFTPFTAHALGLDLWEYLGGPWSHLQYFPFDN
jgi:2'-5' RNA ligase